MRIEILLALLGASLVLAAPAAGIIDGAVVNPAPGWMAGIYGPSHELCSGSEIAPQWILTAAHCLIKFPKAILPLDPSATSEWRSFTPETAKGFSVAVGTPLLPTTGPLPYAADALYIHPSSEYLLAYNTNARGNPIGYPCYVGDPNKDCRHYAIEEAHWDAGLIHLSKPIADPHPIALGSAADGPAPAVAYGYGLTDGNAEDLQLRRTFGDPPEEPAYQVSRCAGGVGNAYLCAQSTTSQIAAGDSGGPWLQGDTEQEVAITSFKLSPEDYPVDVQAVLPWINSILSLPLGIGHNAIVKSPGCFASELDPNDDGSSAAAPLGFTINFYGSTYNQVYVNNNGNVTLNYPSSQYTPSLLNAGQDMIAPFWADVDTRRPESQPVTYGRMTFQQRPALCVNWVNVGYFDQQADKLNSFQLLIVDRSDVAPGDFDIVMNYDQIMWETGDASGGANGFGGNSAVAGYSAGDGNQDHTYNFPGSAVEGALLDANRQTGLVGHDYGTTHRGRYVFSIRN